MKELKDYLHLYRGCTILFPDKSTATLISADEDAASFVSDEHNQAGFCSIKSTLFGKPILRPLSDMTEEEANKVKWEWMGVAESADETTYQADAAQTIYLLSKQFDLFGLIEAGLAIDATTTTDKRSVATAD